MRRSILGQDGPSDAQRGADGNEARAPLQAPFSFYTAASLYRSHLPQPTAASAPLNDGAAWAAEDAPSTLSQLSSSFLDMKKESTLAAAVDVAPHSREGRTVPAPRTYDVLVHAPHTETSKRCPTPPWWRRHLEAAGGESAAADKSTRAAIHDRGRENAAAVPPQPPLLPVSRSCTGSAAMESRSRTASPPTTHPTSQDDSLVSAVDPAAYRAPRSHRVQRPNLHAAIVPTERSKTKEDTGETAPAHMGYSSASANAYRFYRDPSTSSTTTAGPAVVAFTGRRRSSCAPSHRTQERLRVHEESAAHPSGFPVPRRAHGTAAPRTLYNGLAVLPATAADHHAVTRAAAAGTSSCVFTGRANHPSLYSIQKYRDDIAAEIGFDPVRLRGGILQQRYTRVHSGWVEEIGGSGARRRRSSNAAHPANAVENPSLQHTTTRLRIGLSGGGAPRAVELLDPVSGQSRKPNEVSLDYLRKAVRELQGETAQRHAHAPEAAQRSASRCSSAASDPEGVRAHATMLTSARGEGLCSLAGERRQRAVARTALLHATHAPTGVGLPAEERRLYWAEHAPLHHGTVLGLNTFLHGVGEAETYGCGDDDVSSASLDGAPSVCTRDSELHGAQQSEGRRSTDGREGLMERTRASSRLCRPSASTPQDPVRSQLQDALRRRRGAEGTLTASSILPSAYRPASHEASRSVDMTGYEYDVHDGVATCCNVDASRVHDDGGARNRSGGLVDSYLHHHRRDDGLTASLSSADAASTALRGSDDGGHGRSSRARAQSSYGLHSRHAPQNSSAAYAHHNTAWLFPPMLTPLLQEVDECLRFHGLPVMREMWQWSVADQLKVLRSAGLSAAESQTITWELERMIRSTSTTCAVAV